MRLPSYHRENNKLLNGALVIFSLVGALRGNLSDPPSASSPFLVFFVIEQEGKGIFLQMAAVIILFHHHSNVLVPRLALHLADW